MQIAQLGSCAFQLISTCMSCHLIDDIWQMAVVTEKQHEKRMAGYKRQKKGLYFMESEIDEIIDATYKGYFVESFYRLH